jgi:hypothetical protein
MKNPEIDGSGPRFSADAFLMISKIHLPKETARKILARQDR